MQGGSKVPDGTTGPHSTGVTRARLALALAASPLLAVVGGMGLLGGVPALGAPKPQPGSTPAPSASPSTVAAAAGTAQPGASAQAEQPTPIFVRAVEGKVRHKNPGEENFVDTKVGSMLQEGTEVRVGQKSSIQFQVGAGQVFSIDRLTKFFIREAISGGGKETTKVELEYGRVQFNVTSARVANDVQIASGDATLAIRGTDGGMEVVAGQPTLAYGGPLNRGRFTVTHRGGRVGTITGSEQTNGQKPDPARTGEADLFIDPGDTRSRDPGEFRLVFDYTTIFQKIFGDFRGPGVGIAPPLAGVALIDEVNSELRIFEDPINGRSALLRPVTGLNFGVQGQGLSLRSTPTGGTELLRLESGIGSAELLSLDLSGTGNAFTRIAQFNSIDSGGSFQGLAGLGGELYTLGGGPLSGEVIRLNPASGTFTRSAFLPLFTAEALGAYTTRGTLLVAGQFGNLGLLGGRSETPQGSPGVLDFSAFIGEFDPRTNYLRTALWNGNGDFAFSFDTLYNPSVDPSSNTITNARIVGVTQFRTTIGSGVGIPSEAFALTINVLATVNGTPNTPITLIYNVSATGQTGDPRIIFGVPTDVRSRVLAGERPGSPGASVPLLAAPAGIDTTIGARFAVLAFSPQALASGVVLEMLQSELTQSAVNSVACAQSPAILSLGNFLQARVNTRSGMGAAAFDFRSSLPDGHPCLAPGQTFAPAFFGFNGQSIFSQRLDGSTTPQPGSVTGLTGSPLGFAVRSGGGPLGEALFLTSQTSTGPGAGVSTITTSIFSRLLGDPNAATTLRATFTFSTDPNQNPPVSGISFGGLGIIGNQLFATTLLDAVDAGLQGNQIAELSIGASGGLFSRRMAPEFLMAPVVGAAPTRGTIFTFGKFVAGDTDAPAFVDAVLMEADPRINYVARLFSSNDGSFTPNAGTVTNGLSLSSITAVTGMAYAGNTLVLSGVTSGGQSVIIQYNPDAANTAQDPLIKRLDARQASALFAASRPGTVAGSVNLANPTSAIATDINATFRSMAYSSQAAGSAGLRRIVGEQIVLTGADGAACRASAEFNGPLLTQSLQQFAGQRSGVGQAIARFRGQLPLNHPCRPPP